MEAENLFNLIDQYDPFDKNTALEFLSLSEKYPYFQLPMFYHTKSLKEQGSENYKQNLNKLIESMDTVAGYDLFGFSKEAVEGLKKANKLAKDANPRTYLYDGARALDQARLAFMTSQVGTTVRNTISGYSRVGFDVLTQTINNMIAGITPVSYTHLTLPTKRIV